MQDTSICGLRSFSEASRTCNILARPYLSRPRQVKFTLPISSNTQPRSIGLVTLGVSNRYKTLRIKDIKYGRNIYVDRTFDQESIRNALRENSSYPHLEFLVHSYQSQVHWNHGASVNILNIFATCMPLLARLTIALPELRPDCMRWKWWEPSSAAGTQLTERRSAYVKTMDVLSKFESLRHLQIQVWLEGEWSTVHFPLLRRKTGCEIAQSFHRFLSRQRGRDLEQLDFIVVVSCRSLLGSLNTQTLRAVMSYRVDQQKESFSGISLYDAPGLEMILDCRARVEEQMNLEVWNTVIGPSMWLILRKEWPSPSEWNLSVAKAIVPMGLAYVKSVKKPSARLWNLYVRQTYYLKKKLSGNH